MRFGGCQGHKGDSFWNCDVKKSKKSSTGHWACGLRGQGLQLEGRGRSDPGPRILSNGVVPALALPVRSLAQGRLPGLGLGNGKTWDSPGSPLLPGLPRRPGGPRQENKDRLVKKGSQWAWAQQAGRWPTYPPRSSIRGAACPPPCWLVEGRRVGRNTSSASPPPCSPEPSPVGCALTPQSLIQLFNYLFIYPFAILPQSKRLTTWKLQS